MTQDDRYPSIPDVRDGLTHKERIILTCLHELQTSRAGRNVPTAMLYGRVVEFVDISIDEMQHILQRFVGNSCRD